jgi:hypothetical protein
MDYRPWVEQKRVAQALGKGELGGSYAEVAIPPASPPTAFDSQVEGIKQLWPMTNPPPMSWPGIRKLSAKVAAAITGILFDEDPEESIKRVILFGAAKALDTIGREIASGCEDGSSIELPYPSAVFGEESSWPMTSVSRKSNERSGKCAVLW